MSDTLKESISFATESLSVDKKRKPVSEAEKIAVELSKLTSKYTQQSKVKFEEGKICFLNPDRVLTFSEQCTWKQHSKAPCYCSRAEFRFESSLPDRNYLTRFSVACKHCYSEGASTYHLYCSYCDEILTGSIAGPGGKIADHLITIRHVHQEAVAFYAHFQSRSQHSNAQYIQARKYLVKLEEWSDTVRFPKRSLGKFAIDEIIGALRLLIDEYNPIPASLLKSSCIDKPNFEEDYNPIEQAIPTVREPMMVPASKTVSERHFIGSHEFSHTAVSWEQAHGPQVQMTDGRQQPCSLTWVPMLQGPNGLYSIPQYVPAIISQADQLAAPPLLHALSCAEAQIRKARVQNADPSLGAFYPADGEPIYPYECGNSRDGTLAHTTPILPANARLVDFAIAGPSYSTDPTFISRLPASQHGREYHNPPDILPQCPSEGRHGHATEGMPVHSLNGVHSHCSENESAGPVHASKLVNCNICEVAKEEQDNASPTDSWTPPEDTTEISAGCGDLTVSQSRSDDSSCFSPTHQEEPYSRASPSMSQVVESCDGDSCLRLNFSGGAVLETFSVDAEECFRSESDGVDDDVPFRFDGDSKSQDQLDW